MGDETAPGRRTVLTGMLAAPLTGWLATGCSRDGAAPSGHDGPAAPTTSPGAVLRARAAQDSRDLLARYDATIAAYPALASRLRPLRTEVVRHIAAFTVGPVPSGGSPRSVTEVLTDGSAAVAALAREERRLADGRDAALAGAPPQLARLLASVAAAGACHALLLMEGSTS